jgi:predicted transcriptional regulator
MDLHYGQIVEKRVRRSGFSITELARNTKVNRRSVYNWFNQKKLNIVIIHRIGCAMDYDFSIDFPELFTTHDFNEAKFNKNLQRNETENSVLHDNGENWKDKYVQLLEKYNTLLKSKFE